MYLTKQDALEIVKRLKSFESDLNEAFTKRGYSLRNNAGRRNALISIAQERETANVLRKRFKDVIEDGMPGKPDIYIEDIKRELECKLTSGSKTKGKSRAYSFQTDWATICNKKKLDYVYLVCNEEFDSFCFLYFEGLTPDDFFPPAPGSRGKSRMNKAKAMKKVTCLLGDYTTKNNIQLENIKGQFINETNEHLMKSRESYKKYNAAVNEVLKNKIKNQNDKEFKRHSVAVKKLQTRLDYWKNATPMYKFSLESI